MTTTVKLMITVERLDPKHDGCPYCGEVDAEPATHLSGDRCQPPKRAPLQRPENGWPWERGR